MLKRIDSNELCRQGEKMNEREFDAFIRVHASDCYWKISAERARRQLEDQLRDNRQLHQLLNELTNENEQLHVKTEHYEYLNRIFNSILSDSPCVNFREGKAVKFSVR